MQRLTEEPEVVALMEAAAAVHLPAIGVLAMAVGLPSGVLALLSIGTNLGSLFLSSRAARIKLERHNAAICEALGLLESEVQHERTAREQLATEVQAMWERLSLAQVEQLAQIMEDTLRAADEDWLEILRRAAKGVVREEVEASTRRAVLAGLRTLGPEHVRRLVELGQVRPAVQVPGVLYPHNLGREDAVLAALVGVGFVNRQQDGGEVFWFCNELGAAALRLLRYPVQFAE